LRDLRESPRDLPWLYHQELRLARDDYEYDHLFTEPDQIQRFGEVYLAERRKRRRAAAKPRAKTNRPRPPGVAARPAPPRPCVC